MYNETVKEHFINPRNVGTIENPDAHARVESDVHNDLIELYLVINDDRIDEIKFRAFGCAAAIAASSMTTELAQGMSLDEALALDEEDVVVALGGLPPEKIVCSVLGPSALHQAIETYRQKQ